MDGGSPQRTRRLGAVRLHGTWQVMTACGNCSHWDALHVMGMGLMALAGYGVALFDINLGRWCRKWERQRASAQRHQASHPTSAVQ